jgi:Secretion system C-terminal sorting domain
MKKQFILIYVIVATFFEVAHAQYLPVFVSSKTTFDLLAGVPDATLIGKIEIQGDSVLNGIVYKKVWYQVEFYPFAIVGFTRQNLENSKLYFLDIKSQSEYLVMNLDLDVGDEFPYFNASECENLQGNNIAKVVSVQIINGRKQVTFDKLSGGSFFCDSLKFIEGFGSNTSIFFQSPFLECEFPALAYKACKKLENNALSYPTSSIDFCGNTTNAEDTLNSDNGIIEPNPFSNQLNIKTEINTKISIYTATGILKLHDSAKAENIEINTTNWQSGIYYVLINGKFGSVTQKIVKP